MQLSDWQFVKKILDLTEGHDNGLRAKMIVSVLRQLDLRRVALMSEVPAPRSSAQEESAWLLALGKPLPHVTA